MLKIGIFGTGGVGGIFGALFAKAGHSVSFVARGEHLERIQKQGLKILSPEGNWMVQPLWASSNPSEGIVHSSPLDLILVCVKTWQLREAREQISPLVGSQTLILPLQNGVEATEFFLEKFPHSQVLRGFCAVISFVESPGVIRHVGVPPYLCLGELSSPHVSPRIHNLKKELSVPGLVLETPENLLTQQWQKFLFISSLAAITSCTRLPAGPLLQLQETRTLLENAMKEVVALGRKKDITFPAQVVEKAMKRVEEMPFDGTTSMQRDFQSGRRTELETFSGYVSREGKKLGVPTPIHDTCYSLLLPHERAACAGLK